MEKIVVHTLVVSKPKQKILFEILLPENCELLTGVEASTNRHVISAHSVKYPHRGAGILRLFVADDGDCIFSQMIHADHCVPKWQASGEVLTSELWKQTEPLPAFLTKQFTKATLISGYYEDMVGDVTSADPNYTVTIYLYFEPKTIEQP